MSKWLSPCSYCGILTAIDAARAAIRARLHFAGPAEALEVQAEKRSGGSEGVA